MVRDSLNDGMTAVHTGHHGRTRTPTETGQLASMGFQKTRSSSSSTTKKAGTCMHVAWSRVHSTRTQAPSICRDDLAGSGQPDGGGVLVRCTIG